MNPARLRHPSWFFVAFGTSAAALVALVRQVGNNGWDDGAITLAFARTLHASGRFALTPLSEQVEGSSSVAWLLFNTVPQFFGASFDSAVRFSQLSAAAFALLAGVSMVRVGLRLGLGRTKSAAAALAFMVSGQALSETVNGMEMLALAFLTTELVVVVLDDRVRSFQGVLIALLFPMVRFEAMFYLGLFVLFLAWRRRPRDAMALAVPLVAVVCVLTVVRLRVFGDVMPNTIWAKMRPPYSQGGGLINRAWAVVELPALFAPLMLGTLLLGSRRTRIPDPTSPDAAKIDPVLLVPAAGAVLFSAVAGTNMGYFGRMQLFAVPAALLFASALPEVSLEVRGRRIPFCYAFLGAFLGLSWMTAFPKEALALSRSNDKNGTTPEWFRGTGQVADRVRAALGQDSLTFMMPDVGGAALCCERLRIVDLGMLANKVLARKGFAALEGQLASERPEIIEGHAIWAKVSGLYSAPSFGGYVPCIIDSTRVFARSDVYAELRKRLPFEDVDSPSDSVFFRHRYAGHTWLEDELVFAKPRRIAVFSTRRDSAPGAALPHVARAPEERNE